MNIFERVQRLIDQAFREDRRIAVVWDNAVGTGLIAVEYDGAQDPTGYRYLGALPAEGDTVLMIRFGGKWVILGELAAL